MPHKENKTMIKLVIFDLDGTLLNSLDDLADSCNYILAKNGFETHPLHSYRYFVGNGVAKLVERALPENHRDSHFVEFIRKQFVEYYSKHAEDKTAPYDGINDLLAGLTARGIQMAVASNKFMAGTEALVREYFGNFKFVSVLGQREGIPVKPDPQIVYDIMSVSGITNKSEILYVGDTSVDIQTCLNAGIKSVGVEWGFRTREELLNTGADYIVACPNEILNLLD